MLNVKRFSFLHVAITIFLFASTLITGCTSQEDAPKNETTNTTDSSLIGDTIFLDTDAPIIEKSEMNSISNRTLNILKSFNNNISRSDNNLDIYHFTDTTTNKQAYAIAHPALENAWIYECYVLDTDEPTILIFEQLDSTNFVIKDEYGVELRSFTFKSDELELWTYNNSISRLSRQDSFLCGAAFTAACVLVGEAFAIPSGGASLAVSMGFFTASFYICN